MVKYFKIVLKNDFQVDNFIKGLNKLLINHYGATLPEDFLFNSWSSLKKKADNFNYDLPDYFCMPIVVSPVPVTAEQLSDNLEKFEHGAFAANLLMLSDEHYLSAFKAIMKWIADTEGLMVNYEKSQNYHWLDLEDCVPENVLREIFS